RFECKSKCTSTESEDRLPSLITDHRDEVSHKILWNTLLLFFIFYDIFFLDINTWNNITDF
ncbi:MAG: hypothetical protein ACOCQP_03170, partial [Lentisphaeria bacterium]